MINDSKHHDHLLSLLQVFAKLLDQVNDLNYIKRSSSYNLSKRQFEILKILYHSGPYTVSDLSMFLMISKPATSKSVNALVKAGLVTREVPPLDRRKVLVTLLPPGKEMVQRYHAALRAQGKRILSQFTPAEVQALETTLTKYLRALLEEYRHQTDLICMNCNSRFLEECPLVEEGQPFCYHAIVETAAEVI